MISPLVVNFYMLDIDLKIDRKRKKGLQTKENSVPIGKGT